jgi:hypothetical protein
MKSVFLYTVQTLHKAQNMIPEVITYFASNI